MSGNAQGVRWCFTINNWSPEELEGAMNPPQNVSLLVAGKEVGASGTPHLQGYMELHVKTMLSRVKKECPWLLRSHLEIARGSRKSNIEYCMKEDKDAFTFNVPVSRAPVSGKKRTRLDEMIELVEQGYTSEEVYDVDPMLYLSTRKEAREVRRLKSKVIEVPEDHRRIWMYGPTGIGKSRLARLLLHDFPVSYIQDEGKWFTDCPPKVDAVLIDDYDKCYSDKQLRRVLDRYVVGVPRKMIGPIHIMPKLIVITAKGLPVDHIHDPKYAEDVTRRVELWDEARVQKELEDRGVTVRKATVTQEVIMVKSNGKPMKWQFATQDPNWTKYQK